MFNKLRVAKRPSSAAIYLHNALILIAKARLSGSAIERLGFMADQPLAIRLVGLRSHIDHKIDFYICSTERVLV